MLRHWKWVPTQHICRLNVFFWCILMSCVPYPQIRIYWSKALQFPAITERFTRDRFFRLRRSLKVLIPEDLRECDKFWKVRPFLDRILKGCRSQARPKCVSINEQMIPFTGTCPSANEAKPSWHEELCLRYSRLHHAGL